MKDELILITGMHRSSTSLITQYLSRCGLCLGNNLLGVAEDNKEGYFENRKIVNIHNQILKNEQSNIFNGLKINKFKKKDVVEITNELNKIKKGNKKKEAILIKDPRISLFLNAWEDAYPGARFIFIYRDYKEVIESLFKRQTDKVLRRKPWLTAESWIRYNENILSFYYRNKEKCIIVSNDVMIENSKKAIEFINEKYKLNLEIYDIDKIYKPDLTSRKKPVSLITKIIVFLYNKKLNNIFEKLNKENIIDLC